MPVGTVATVKGVPQETLEELGVEILLANTYHLFLRPGAEIIRKLGGLHRFMSWERSILTDSGGYQVFSLSNFRKVREEGVEFRSHLDGALHFLSPETATAAQIALGADIIMAFDECTEYPADRDQAAKSMEMTARWAGRCKKYFEEHKQEVPWASSAVGPRSSAVAGLAVANDQRPTTADQLLFGIVQGGMYADLRRESAERTVEIGFPGYAIGGLSVGEPREFTREMVEATLPHLPQERPRYLMGVGTPDEIVEYAARGIDMMDCVLPSRNARNGCLFTSQGAVRIKQARYRDDAGPLDPQCGCYTCTSFSRAYLRHLFQAGELLYAALATLHNVKRYLDIMREIRHAILSGRYPEYLLTVRSAPVEIE